MAYIEDKNNGALSVEEAVQPSNLVLSLGKQVVEDVEATSKAPESIAIGNEKITILNHSIYKKSRVTDSTEEIGIELKIKNDSDEEISSVLFEAVLKDIEGNILDTVEHKTFNLKPNANRTINISYSGPNSYKITGYCINVTKTTFTPTPTAIGNDKIIIMHHERSILEMDDYRGGTPPSVQLSIRNISDLTFARVIFEAAFFDNEGNIIDIVKHTEVELKPGISRSIIINSSLNEFNVAKSYYIKIIKMTTVDIEKVQIRSNEIRISESGDEVTGTVKNISTVKTDTGLVATFYDSNKEIIGTKIIILRDIDPNNIKQFHFIFKPQTGDTVSKYTLTVGEII